MKIKTEIHMHSTFSDGQFSPAELVAIARANRVSILSLTDHDTFDGVEEFLTAAAKEKISGFPGIEITVAFRQLNLHLLAYFKDIAAISPELQAKVDTMKQKRENRMREIINRLNPILPENFRGRIQLENVKKAAEGVIGRPHLAREMTRQGIVSSTAEAFEKYLVRYNVEKENLGLEEALQLVHASKGVAVLAHPGERAYSLYNPQSGMDYNTMPATLRELKVMGLDGLECVYPHHERAGKADFFLEQARQLDLIATGSRDFHGATTSQDKSLLGSANIDPVFFEKFKEIWSK